MTDRKIMDQALDARDRVMSHGSAVQEVKNILRERLAQPEQCQYPQCQCATENPCLKGLKPVFDCPRCGHCCPPQGIYYTPPQRKPLSEEEIQTYRHMIDWTAEWSYINFARAIEAAHGIKGKA